MKEVNPTFHKIPVLPAGAGCGIQFITDVAEHWVSMETIRKVTDTLE